MRHADANFSTDEHGASDPLYISRIPTRSNDTEKWRNTTVWIVPRIVIIY